MFPKFFSFSLNSCQFWLFLYKERKVIPSNGSGFHARYFTTWCNNLKANKSIVGVPISGRDCEKHADGGPIWISQPCDDIPSPPLWYSTVTICSEINISQIFGREDFISFKAWISCCWRKRLFSRVGITAWINHIRCPDTFPNCKTDTYGHWYKSKHCNFTFWSFSSKRKIDIFLELIAIFKSSISREGIITDFFIFIRKLNFCNRRITWSRYTSEHPRLSVQLRAYRPDNLSLKCLLSEKTQLEP